MISDRMVVGFITTGFEITIGPLARV